MTEKKTHYRQAFDSPYLSSADIVKPTVLTISHVALEPDATKRKKEKHNTAHFVEKELSEGHTLKPMILNATNSEMMRQITGSHFLQDWKNIRVQVEVKRDVRFGSDVVDGLRIKAAPEKQTITPETVKSWSGAKTAYRRDGNLNAVLARANMSAEHQKQLIDECAPQSAVA